MAKLSLENQLKKVNEKAKKIKQKIKEEQSKKPLKFVSEIEKIFNKKFTDSDYKNILDAIKNNKSNYATYWKLAPAPTTTTNTIKK